MKDTLTARSAELDEYAKRLNTAHAAAVAARSGETDGDGVTLHAEITPPVCVKCGGMERQPGDRPEGCPNCIARHFCR